MSTHTAKTLHARKWTWIASFTITVLLMIKVKCPVLALNGAKDVQITPQLNLTAIEQTLKQTGNQNFKTLELARLNHLFQTAQTGSPSEYKEIEETFSPTALKLIADWIEQKNRI
jgi:hypothetical protein